MNVSGTLTPPLAGESISIVYTPSTGDPVTHTTTTGGDGSYQDSFKLPAKQGPWHVQAHWPGNGQYLPADSGTCTVAL